MNRLLMAVVIAVVSTVPLAAAGGNSVTGVYVEARTAEVFTGGCIMGSEAETSGRQAVLAWKIDRGSINGVQVDGLSIVAAVVGDKNLGIHELGGEKPVMRSALIVDDRANAEQRVALIAMAKELSSVMGTVVSITSAPIAFADKPLEVQVAAPQIALAVEKQPEHSVTCGAQQWFHPLASVDNAGIGLAKQHSFKGSALGSKWSDPDKMSAFFGTFTY